jgi:hypothetical protein
MFMGVNVVLLSTITPVYDFVCFHPYWDRRVTTPPLLPRSPLSFFPTSGNSPNHNSQRKTL